MSTFPNVKLKFRIPIRLYFCARREDPTAFMMLSLIQRIIRHSIVISRQGFSKRLNIVKLNSKVRGQGGDTVVAPLTKNSNSKVDVIQFILQSLAGTVREVFVTNVLRRNNAIVSPVWQRFGGNGRPFFGLVGIGFAAGGKTLTDDHEFERICGEIRNTLRPTKEEQSTDLDVEDVELKLKSARYIGKGQNGAIYQINLNAEDLAVKVMFNFDLQSNASTILRGMMRELVPSTQRIQGIDSDDMKRCPPHPNIVDIKSVLTSRNVPLPGALEHWPDALPANFNGYGRNMTMYTVMKLYDSDLETYLHNTTLNSRERILILAQMLEATSHLKMNGIAHRDLKANNFLVKVLDYPHIVITDFGHCLASKKHPLQLPYPTEDMEIGGNPALLAPELVCTKPGTFKWLNYEKSDTWAVGAIAYEIFGQLNPFYVDLTSKHYDEKDLPPLENAPSVIERVVKGLLKKNPRERLSCELAATICYVFLWGPRSWLQRKEGGDKTIVADVEILRWLMLLTSKVIWNTSYESEMNLINTFLKRVNYNDVQKAVRFCR